MTSVDSNTLGLSYFRIASIALTLFSSPSWASSICNLDPFYKLPDFSRSSYDSRCNKNDTARVRREDVRLYCNKEQNIEVVDIHEKEQQIIFDCSYMDVNKNALSRVYQWQDNEGNLQFTNNPPPPSCLSTDCKNIRIEIAAQRDLDTVMESAIARFRGQKEGTRSRERLAELKSFPTARHYLEAQSTDLLCSHLSLMNDEEKHTQLVLKLMDLYDLEHVRLLVREFILELSNRLKSETIDVGKLFLAPGSVWIGMKEELLICSRPDPDLIYDEAEFFGSKKKQYVYEIEPNFELVDIQNGFVSKITMQPF